MTVTLGQACLRVLRFTPSVSLHQRPILTYHQSQRALAMDSVVKKQTKELGPTYRENMCMKNLRDETTVEIHLCGSTGCLR